MITTSDEYKTSIVKRTQRQTFGKIEINYTDPFTDASIVVSSSSISNVSFLNQVTDGILDPTHNWFPLDGTAIQDGSFKLMPASTDADLETYMETGWWSGEVSGALGAFTSPQILTVTFVARTIESLLVYGDSIKEEYPVDFTIELYDDEDTLLHTETVTGNATVKWSSAVTGGAHADVVKQVLSITKWSHVGRCAKIIEFFTMLKRTYLGNNIFSMELLEERDPDNGSLPVGNISANQFTAKLYNFARQFDAGSGSAISNLIKPRRKVVPYIGAAGVSGVTEWIPLGVFWTKEWDVPDDDLYAGFTALDLLDLMGAKSNYTPGLLTDQTLYDIIVAACIDFGIAGGGYVVDADLDVTTIPYAYIKNTSHREIIRLAAEAGLAQVYCGRTGILNVEGSDFLADNKTVSQKTITAAMYFRRSNPTRWENVKNVVRVKTQPLVPDVGTTEVYREADITVPAGGSKVVTCFYTTEPVINGAAALDTPPAGLTITAETYYAWGATITIGNSSGSPENVTLYIEGNVLRINGSRQVEARDAASIIEFGELIYEFPDNPFVQTEAQAQAIADALIASYASGSRDLTQEWRGDPALELSDRITTDDGRASTDDYWITRQQLTWDGTLRASHEGRRAT